MSRIRSRMTFANVVSVLALFVALGGSATAAVLITGKNVKDGSLTGKDIKNNSVGSVDVKDGGLLLKDFKPGQLVAGAPGPAGPQGPQGPKGDTGAKGDTGPAGPFPATLPSGKTIVGNYAIGGTGGGGSGTVGEDSISFGYPLESEPTVQFIANGTTAPAECPGTAAAPAAAPGNLCIWEARKENIAASGECNPLASDGSANKNGACVWATPTNTALRFLDQGTWAVTAP